MDAGALDEFDFPLGHEEAVDVDVHGVAHRHVHFDVRLHEHGVARKREHGFDGFGKFDGISATSERKRQCDHCHAQRAQSDVDEAIRHGWAGYRLAADNRMLPARVTRVEILSQGLRTVSVGVPGVGDRPALPAAGA